MAKKVSSNTTRVIEKTLTDLSEITYTPTQSARKVKAAFWSKYAQNPSVSTDKITAALVEQVTGSSIVSKNWGLPGFKAWLLNEDEWVQRQEYLAHLAQDIAEEILLDPLAPMAAKTSLIKLLWDSTGRTARKSEPLMIDKDIQGMDEKQLKQFLGKFGVKLDSEDKQSTSGS